MKRHEECSLSKKLPMDSTPHFSNYYYSCKSAGLFNSSNTKWSHYLPLVIGSSFFLCHPFLRASLSVSLP